MKASELIKELQELIDEHGDVECLTYDMGYLSPNTLESVECVTYHKEKQVIVIDCEN